MTNDRTKTYSITRRLTALMFVIAIFFITIALAQYISNRGYIQGLSRINSINVAINNCSLALEGLTDSLTALEKIETKKNVEKNLFYFVENQKEVHSLLDRNMKLKELDQESRDKIQKAITSLASFEKSVTVLEGKHSEAGFLIARQFSSDAKEDLRKAQIDLRAKSNVIFSKLYSDRFLPTIIVFILSALFFLFVSTFGLKIANRIKTSVTRLGDATDRVTRGDYSFHAEILHGDEFGTLTNRFNAMTSAISHSKEELTKTIERIHVLQALSQKLAEALRPEEAMDITIEEGIKTLKANSSSVLTLNPEKTFIEVSAFQGIDPNYLRRWMVFPINMRTPVSDAIRTGKPVFLESLEDYRREYPEFAEDFASMRLKATAILPLIAGKHPLGVIAFNFEDNRPFSQEEREFALSISRQMGHALYRTQLYDEAQRAVEARDEFLSIASHELKTPLTPLKLQLQMMARNLTTEKIAIDKDKVLKTLSDCDHHFNRLSKLILNLLDISRISSGKLVLSPEQTDVNQLIKNLVVTLKDQISQTQAELHFEEQDEVVASIDPDRFEQVIMNLITNAIKYAVDKPIRVVLSKQMNTFQVRVIDQGPGIEPKDFGRIFQKFERISSVDNVGGLGLGLYITKQIVESHKGSIWVESGPEKGATFIVELPLRVS